jgi:predicted RNA-binding Zn ribbon-like protein
MSKATTKSDWKDSFLFVGNQLTLDFLNTRPVQDGKPSELLPDFGALLRWFQAAALLSSREVGSLQRQWGGSVSAQRTTQAMRKLRERLRKEILAWEHSGSVQHSIIEELNNLMAEHPMRTRLSTGGKSCVTELWFEPHEPEDLFGPLAHSAATLFATVDRKRVRKCAQCVLHFHDISKKGTRRWCSMQLCGNRLKVAAYATRRRQSAHKPHKNDTGGGRLPAN